MNHNCKTCGAMIVLVAGAFICNCMTSPNMCAPFGGSSEYCGTPFLRPNDDDEPAGRIYFNNGSVPTTAQASGGSGGISVPWSPALGGHPINRIAINGTFDEPRSKNGS